MPTLLVKFNGSGTQSLGMIELPVLIETHPQQVSTMTNFIVVGTLSVYNVILGRPTLKSVVSTYSLVVKFPTPQGAEILRGDQATAWSCYVTSLRKDAVSETLAVEESRKGRDKPSRGAHSNNPRP